MANQGGSNYGPQFKPARHDSDGIFQFSIKRRHIPWIVAFFGIGGVGGVGGLLKAWQVEDKVEDQTKTQTAVAKKAAVGVKREQDTKVRSGYKSLVRAVEIVVQQNEELAKGFNAQIEKNKEQDELIIKLIPDAAAARRYRAKAKEEQPKPVVIKKPVIPPSPEAAVLVEKAKEGIDPEEKEEAEDETEQSEENGETP